MGRLVFGNTVGEYDWEEDGRGYVGIPELIADLPQLRHLWVNERVLSVPSPNNEGDKWNARPFDGASQDAIMLRTVDSPQWELLGHAFEKLETLKVGFGPLNVKWVTKVLSLCNPIKLQAFGFDLEWNREFDKPVRIMSYPHVLTRVLNRMSA